MLQMLVSELCQSSQACTSIHAPPFTAPLPDISIPFQAQSPLNHYLPRSPSLLALMSCHVPTWSVADTHVMCLMKCLCMCEKHVYPSGLLHARCATRNMGEPVLCLVFNCTPGTGDSTYAASLLSVRRYLVSAVSGPRSKGGGVGGIQHARAGHGWGAWGDRQSLTHQAYCLCLINSLN